MKNYCEFRKESLLQFEKIKQSKVFFTCGIKESVLEDIASMSAAYSWVQSLKKSFDTSS